MEVKLEISYEVAANRDGETEEDEKRVADEVRGLIDQFTQLVQDSAFEDGLREIRIERESA